MPTFRLTIRFLDAAFHGRADGGEPEWPPSPLRAFQALIAAAAARWRLAQFEAYARPALEWLEALGPPDVLAPVGWAADRPYRLYVPNNAADLVVASWARGNPDASIADHRTEKDVRPTRLLNGDAVHFDWPLTPAQSDAGLPHRMALKAMARSITHLGWGIDQVVGTADFHDTPPPAEGGEPWRPVPTGGTPLRLPKGGTLAALRARHREFLGRLRRDGLNPVPPLTTFHVVGYGRPTVTAPRPFAAFELRTPDFERARPFNSTRHTSSVAGMVRNALGELARDMRPFGWTSENIQTFVHGHTPNGRQQNSGPGADRRFAYLPLPSLERRGGAGVVVTAVRRVLVVGPPGGEQQVVWARVLSGRELTPLNERTPPAALRLIDRPAAALRNDPNLGPYVGEWRVWSTVTPVILPGYEDPRGLRGKLKRNRGPEVQKRLLLRLERRAEGLLRKAFRQAGLPPELVDSATLEWRTAGFRPGVELAQRYHRPESQQKMPAYHVRVRFPVLVRGPLSIGRGRYRGLGVFAGECG
jgi:CRISPR-associated protein Csb2